MSCGPRKLTRKRVILYSSLGVGVVGGTYLAFTTTNNPALAAAIPLISGFAICPAMCAVMGGIMWIMSRRSKNKDSENKDEKSTSKRLEKGEFSSSSHSENGHTNMNTLKEGNSVQPEITAQTLRNKDLRTSNDVDVQPSHQMKKIKESQ